MVRPKLSRTGARKTRTGCITCKKRHMRCDEAKPACLNCTRSLRCCEGYAGRSDQLTKTVARSNRPLRPNTQAAEASATAYPRLLREPSDVLYGDGENIRSPRALGMLYLDEFVELVQGPMGGALSTNTFWRTTIPQVARTDPTLGHIAMAIGALSVWHRSKSSHARRPGHGSPPPNPFQEHEQSLSGSSSTAAAHRTRAIAYYCQAFRLQRQNPFLRDAILLSVLSMLFEVLSGNRRSALDHINHGMAMMLAVVADGCTPPNNCLLSVPNTKPLLADLAEVFASLGTQIRVILRGKVGYGIPLPHLTRALHSKSHTLESFLLVLRQLPRQRISHTDFSSMCIPPVIHTLDEYESYLTLIQAELARVGPIIADLMQTNKLLDSVNVDQRTVFFHLILSEPRVSLICETSRLLLDGLSAATHSLLQEPPAKAPDYLRLLHHRLSHLSLFIFQNPPQYLDYRSMQALTPHFHEFLSLASLTVSKARANIPHPAHRISLRSDLAGNIFLAAFHARDALVRDHAIALLREYPLQDGLWDTRSLYTLALRNREVERENAKEGTPQEQLERLWRREYFFEEGGEEIVFRFLERGDTAVGDQWGGDGGGDGWRFVEERTIVKGDMKLEDVSWRKRPLQSDSTLLIASILSDEGDL